jgi:hypothetical protein
VDRDPVYLPKIRIRKDTQEQSSWGFTGKTMGLFLLVIVLGTLIGSFYLNQASRAATAGLEIVYLTKEKERLRQDNAELRRQIAEMEALSSVIERAEQLGFTERENVEYLIIDSLPTETREEEHSASVAPEGAGVEEGGAIPSQLMSWWEGLIAEFESWTNPQP